MAKKNTNSENVTREAKAIELRKAFFEKFKKAFDTKTVTAEADSGSWRPEYEYVHIFEAEVKHQLYYYRMTSAKTIYFVVSVAIAEKLDADDFIIKRKDVIKKRGEKQLHTCTKLYVDATADVKEIAKFAKRLTATAHAVAKEKQTEKTKEAEA